MMIKIDGEEDDGIKICDHINVLLKKTIRTSTYNFDAKSKWFEYYVTLNKPLTTYQASIGLATLNHGFIKLLQKNWITFTKSKGTKCYDNLQNEFYTYKFRCYRIVELQPFTSSVTDEEKKNSFF